MAWRIHEHVLRGEIDNRTRGRVTGNVWLAGVAKPIVLDLEGDCHPDLAGCALTFENPAPIALATRPPALRQSGTAGDITAARKVRVFDIPVAEAYMMLKRGGKPPEHMANSLYLEWYSDLNGRIVIESSDYRLQISEPAWRFTAEELAERERQREEGSDAFATEIHADGTVREWDEFRGEQMLRESDALGEKYRRLLEKYADHPDAERIIAHEMGWERMDEEQDEDEAAEIARMNEICEAALAGDAEEPEPDPSREGIDWVRDQEEGLVHPLYHRASTACDALLAELKAAGHFPDSDDETLGEFTGQFMTLAVKLAGATGGLVHGTASDDGSLVIAWLKRTLEIHNGALAAADAMAGTAFLTPERLAHHRGELFAIREGILALIARLREA